MITFLCVYLFTYLQTLIYFNKKKKRIKTFLEYFENLPPVPIGDR